MSTGFGLIFWNVEIVKYIKMKDVFRRGSSLNVSHVFSILSTQHGLTYEQRLCFKKEGRPCPKVTLKNQSSDSVYRAFHWVYCDANKNMYFCWPCLIMGDLSTLSFSFWENLLIALL